jgi:NAD(P)H dehydrogenase (quinone)
MHWGAVLVPPGYTDGSVFGAGGNPYGASVTQAEGAGVTAEKEAVIRHQARRLVAMAGKLAA